MTAEQYLRKSMLEAWIACPKRYELMFVKKVKPKRTVALTVGTLFHEYARRFFDIIDYDKLLRLTDVKDKYLERKVVELFAETLPAHPLLRPLCLNFIKFEAKLWVKLLYMFDDPIRYFVPIAREEHIISDELGLESTIDRIDRLSDDSYVNIEYKTGYHWSIRDLRRELSFYNILANASKRFDKPVTHIAAYNPRLNRYFVEPVSQRLLQATRRRILQFKRSQELGIYERRKGRRCYYCLVLDKCLEEEQREAAGEV
ncbi:MAG: hypothetical protein DRN81_03495 [Thermoproteota archaeon]|nr:MAG: hypothetical protein DRN81_03495 [Candidatus Korarchaeota archaeon]